MNPKRRERLWASLLCSVPGCALLLLMALSLPVFAQQEAAVAPPSTAEDKAETLVLGDAEASKFDTMLAELDARRAQIESLEAGFEASGKATRAALQLRLARLWIDLLEEGNSFASAVYDRRDDGAQASDYWEQAVAELNGHLDVARFATTKLSTDLVVPASDMPPAEQAIASAHNTKLVKLQDRLLKQMFESLALSEQYGLVVADQRQLLERNVAERAQSNSVLLDAAMMDVENYGAVLSVLPDDADVKAQLAVSRDRVSTLAASLQSAVALMKKLDMDSTVYNQQIISGTGQISSDTVSVSVLGNLAAEWTKNLRNWLVHDGPDLVVKLVLFLLFLLAALKLSRMAARLVDTALKRSNVDVSRLLHNMLVSVVSKLVLAIGILFALSQIGISLGPVLAGMGVAGFVIGFALQDTLSNFASGMMILVYRPFDVGDVVEAGGVAGTVNQMSLVSTTILTFDNQTLVVPNNKIWGDVIKNVTAQRTRRVDLVFSISYDDDIAVAEQILQAVVAGDERVLSTPEPTIKLHQLADSSVNFIVRPWVNTGDYWGVYWDITRLVKERFDAAGITIPYPQMSVHIENREPSEG